DPLRAAAPATWVLSGRGPGTVSFLPGSGADSSGRPPRPCGLGLFCGAVLSSTGHRANDGIPHGGNRAGPPARRRLRPHQDAGGPLEGVAPMSAPLCVALICLAAA